MSDYLDELSAHSNNLLQAVGWLRQWLNEDRITDPKKMVTSEELMVWLEKGLAKAVSEAKVEAADPQLDLRVDLMHVLLTGEQPKGSLRVLAPSLDVVRQIDLIIKVIDLHTKALLEELLEQKQHLILADGIRREAIPASILEAKLKGLK